MNVLRARHDMLLSGLISSFSARCGSVLPKDTLTAKENLSVLAHLMLS